MLAEAKVVVHARLRSGNRLPPVPVGSRRLLSRDIGQAAGGFSALRVARRLWASLSPNFSSSSNAAALPYAIAVRMNPHPAPHGGWDQAVDAFCSRSICEAV